VFDFKLLNSVGGKLIPFPEAADTVCVVLVVVVLSAIAEILVPRVVVIVLCGRPIVGVLWGAV